MMAWKWVETKTLGQFLPLEMKCLSDAAKSDNPSIWRERVSEGERVCRKRGERRRESVEEKGGRE